MDSVVLVRYLRKSLILGNGATKRYDAGIMNTDRRESSQWWTRGSASPKVLRWAASGCTAAGTHQIEGVESQLYRALLRSTVAYCTSVFKPDTLQTPSSGRASPPQPPPDRIPAALGMRLCCVSAVRQKGVQKGVQKDAVLAAWPLSATSYRVAWRNTLGDVDRLIDVP